MQDEPRSEPQTPDGTALETIGAVEASTPVAPPPALPVAPTTPVQSSYTPASETRSEWARSWAQNEPVTPERWYEPAPTPAPVTSAEGRRPRAAGSIIAASLLSAVLASGGTVFALGAVGALDRPAPISAAALATNAGAIQPIAIDESSATITVAAKVSPAVVRITVTGAAGSANGVIPATGVGSGVIFDSNGWILTNHHVVEGGEKFDVELKDGRVLAGKVYGIDTLTDLAIVKVDATGLPSAAIGESDALQVGQLVVAIGSPLGTYSNSVTSGIVSAKGRSITTNGNQSLTNLIQTDAAINPGNSGAR